MREINLTSLLPTDPANRDRMRWAVVTDDSPLTIRLEGEPDPLPIVPVTLVPGLTVGQFVWCAMVTNPNKRFMGKRVVVLGVVGGGSWAEQLADALLRLDALEAPLFIEDVENASGTTTSTSYTSTLTGGTACGIAFVAPLSGKVLIHNACSIDNDTAAINTWCSFHVRNGDTIGSGTDFLAAADTFAIQHPGTSVTHLGRAKAVTGLTPGNDYNVIQVFRVSSASTGTFDDKNLIVEGK